MQAPAVIPYQTRFQPRFYEINRAWIEHHFGLEEEDRRVLADPEGQIIAPGGAVFFIEDGGEVAGTCGVMKMDEGVYELVRMSVDERFRGKGYGEALVRHALGWMKSKGAARAILETSSVLKTAIALYERLGFRHYVPDPRHRSGLARADVFMRMDL
jgi:GNAT superfamily N-acetyltransferase